MKLSAKAHYGLRSCFLLAQGFPDSMSATALEKKIKVSAKYIEKIMRILNSRNIITANRGVSGGYYLAREPKKITAGEIVRALEDDFELTPCINSPCKNCATSIVWRKLYDGINDVLNGITLQNMIDDFNENELNATNDYCGIEDNNEGRCLKNK